MSARRLPLKLDSFVVALLVVGFVGITLPASGQVYDTLRPVTVVAIGVLFFLYGVRLSTSETIAGLVNWRLHGAILLTTYVAFPLLGLGLRSIAEPLVGSGLAAGLLFFCLVPTTVQSNVVFTRMAGGDTAGAVVAASMSSMIGVFLTPALVALLMATHAEVTPQTFLRVVLQFLAPFVVGQLCRPLLADWVERNDGWLKHVDRWSVLVVVYLAFSAGTTSGVWTQVSTWSLVGVGVVSIAVLAAACAGLVAAGRLLALTRPARIALLFCGSNKSLATGLPMASVIFPPREVALVVLPLMVYHQLQNVAGSMIASHLNRGPGEPLDVDAS